MESMRHLKNYLDVPENRKDVMRDLPISVKQEFVRGGMQIDKFSTDVPPASPSGVLGLSFFKKSKPKNDVRSKSRGADSSSRSASPNKRTRPLSKSFSAHMDVLVPGSPTKKTKNDKSIHLPLSNGAHNNGPPSPAISVAYSPEEWVSWLKEAGRRRNFGQRMFVEDLTSSTYDLELGMKDVNKDKLHKLRLVLRNEALRWIEAFLNLGGMESLWAVIERVLGVEWREDHEDALYHELLLCLKGLCTTSLALQKLAEMASLIFPRLLTNLFDEDKKGPAEFTTRGIIISLLFMHLSTAPTSSRPLRARRILTWLANKPPTPARRPLDLEIFHSISSAHLHRDTDPVPYTPRPYQNWTKELANTTKEVFWIFLHSANIIPLLPSSRTSSSSYASRHFPLPRPPQPAAAHVGGVEWEATTYIAAHVDLANACIACLVSSEERNEVRREMRNSGWEKVLGGALRLIKDGLHGEAVHDGLRTWVRAASEDGWETVGVRCGIFRGAEPQTPGSR
ncbi:hypothetical protein EX30DRAFT_383376 [Ascodesmis nigricans]|uniref:Formin GTPase-binding domain-containing protein n=1 Tax=Ascodesmis nigricans TaxID=341454 RepID=A0A4S2MNH6_9PEZI|nr:hypothetical protein EX30DRAFT_383376 [Ascodesmis nigricans]